MSNLLKKNIKYILFPWIVWFIIVVSVGYILKSYRPDLNQIYEVTWGAISGFVFIIILLIGIKNSGMLGRETRFYLFYRFVFIIAIVMSIGVLISYFTIVSNL